MTNSPKPSNSFDEEPPIEAIHDKEKKMISAIARCMFVGLTFFLGMIAIAMLPAAASAQDQTFMLVPGIPGSSQDAKHAGWIDVTSLRQTWNSVEKKHNACEIEVGKGLDIAGPPLWAAAVTSQLFPEIRIEVWAVNSEGRRGKIYEIRLGNARITGLVTSGDQTFAENVTIRATTLNLSFFTENLDGSIGSTVTTSVDCN